LRLLVPRSAGYRHLHAFPTRRSSDLILLDQVTGIDEPAVDLAGQGRLGQPGANGLRDLGNGNGVIERTLTAVRKSDDGHGASSRSEEHTSELSHVKISYAVFCLKKKN